MIKLSYYLLCFACLWLPITSQAQLLIQPESVVYDLPRDRHLVSNYSNGAIIAINSEGVQTVFAPGKSSSAGLHIVGNTVYVGCGGEGVLGYDLETGQEVMDVTIPGSVLLNDIASDTSGNLYVSDPYGNKIYRIRIGDHSYSTLVPEIVWPNGLLFDRKNNRLLVCLSTYRDIYTVDLDDGSLTHVVHVGRGHLDGLAEDNAGRIYVSAQGPEAVYRYDPDFAEPPEMVSDGHVGPADIYFNKRKHLLCVPNIGGVTVDFVPIDVPQWTKIADGDVVNDGGGTQGVSWVDYDSNDFLDLFVTNLNLPGGQDNRLYENRRDGTFDKITVGEMVNDGGNSRSGTWGDYDNDGDPDCFVSNWPEAVNFLYVNNGDGTFARVTSGLIVEEGRASSAASWADYNGDGQLDIFVANDGANSLFQNDGGALTKILSGDIATDAGQSRGAAWADYDHDGHPDLFVANAGGDDNLLYHNDGDGTFTKVTGQDIVSDGGESNGGSWGDYDNDGDLDLFVANLSSSTAGHNFLYNNNGDGTFSKVTVGSVVNDGGYSLGSAWGDYDNDGDLDLFVANAPDDGDGEDFLYQNNGDGTFARVTDEAIVTEIGGSSGAAWGDYDRDGDVDLVVARMFDDDEDNVIYCNNGNGYNWINIRCIGTGSNRSAIGTKVRVRTRLGTVPVWQMREVSGQTGYCGQNSLNAHFGLNNAAVIESLVVEWPSGAADTGINVAVNGFLTIIEGEIDPDGDGIIGSFDNCPADYNPDQEDADGDRIGEVCDECPGDAINDPDEDDYCGLIDNCPGDYNPSQQDNDGDLIGNACDNCPDSFNPGQEDINGNGVGDSCEVPETWYVQADGLGEAPTIQAAIDSATHGDTVLVADGVYTGEGNWTLDFRGRHLLLRSENGPKSTIIDCQGSASEPRRAFTFENDEDSTFVVDGFTIRNGYGPYFNGGSSGGGILIDNCSPSVKNCVFTGNRATYGGGVYLYRELARITNCTFADDSAHYGAAVFVYAEAEALMDNCVVAFNRDGQPVYGLALGTATLSCCDVYGNAGGDWVGAISGQLGVDGNFCADPLFCNASIGDVGLSDEASPCLPANNDCSVLIGALGVGCSCNCGFAGDMDCGNDMNPLDVTYLVNYVFLLRDALCDLPNCPYPVGDLDCNNTVNPLDVAYLVSAVYKQLDAICEGCAP